MLAALRTGVSPSGWTMLAREAGIGASEARLLLDRLEPVLQPKPAAASARVAVSGDGPLAQALAELLRDGGSLTDTPAPDLAVLVADWVLGPEDAATWLRRDVPHLPVVASDRSVTVGPFVEPGRTACVYCMQLARTDYDPAWPAVATQLWGRAAPPLSRLAIVSAAAFTARAIGTRLRDGPGVQARGWRISEEGGVISSFTARLHPRCSCAARPESDWAPGSGHADPAVTTTATGSGGHG
jgi:bacteriocin biosynthesis cyclodehydratase domain-containing protein